MNFFSSKFPGKKAMDELGTHPAPPLRQQGSATDHIGAAWGHKRSAVPGPWEDDAPAPQGKLCRRAHSRADPPWATEAGQGRSQPRLRNRSSALRFRRMRMKVRAPSG